MHVFVRLWYRSVHCSKTKTSVGSFEAYLALWTDSTCNNRFVVLVVLVRKHGIASLASPIVTACRHSMAVGHGEDVTKDGEVQRRSQNPDTFAWEQRG